MNKKLIWLISTVFIAIIIILMTLLSVSTNEVNAEESVFKSSSIDIGQLAPGELNPDGYNYYIHAGWFEAEEHHDPPHAIPIYGGYQIYCIEYGGEIRYSDATIKYDEAKELEGKEYTSAHGCADTPREGERTLPIYEEKGSGKLSPALAYIVSGDPVGSFSFDKQYGMWNMAALGLDGGLMMNDGSDGASSYDKVAPDYAEYDELVRDKGLQPEDQTILEGDSEDKLTVKVNNPTGKYTIGPFKMNYTNGIYGDTAFSGISELVALGYNKDGQIVKEDIKVEKILLKDKTTGSYGSAVEPEYFEPDEELKIDETKQVYPEPEQQFQIVISNPNEGVSPDSSNYITGIALKVKFKYMLANGEYALLEGTKYEVSYNHEHDEHCCHSCSSEHCSHSCNGDCCYSCKTTCYLDEIPQQWIATMDAIRSIYEQEIILGAPEEGEPPLIKLLMELGGYVWEDGVATKESKADGVINTQGENIDKRLKNVKVTLYEEDGTIAKLAVNPGEAESEEELFHRVNPTYTDEKGRYLFEGLDPMKKYYVIFEYNGQRYLPTEYLNTGSGSYGSAEAMANAGLYNTTEWKITSKGTELNSGKYDVQEPDDYISRTDYDKRFEEIRSYPENYKSSNNLGWAKNGYNAVYTQKDLMGYVLNEDGTYSQSNTQLIDGYLYDEAGLETTEFKEGEISKAVREYIISNKKFPDENAMKSIYSQIAGGDEELQKMLQFIEDSYIQAYTGAPKSQEKDLYPIFDEFKINALDEGVEIDFDPNNSIDSYFDLESEILDGVEYKPIYYGQYYINLGLWRRQEFDAALRKDVYKAALKINDKTVVYNYDKRKVEDEGANKPDGKDNNTYWDINVRMSDYDAYYGMSYNREIYETDYLFNTSGGIAQGHPGDPLEIYITYKITVRNQSQSIMSEIKEVVDFYDKDYTYKPNLSWVIYQDGGNTNTSINKDKYYEMMDQSQDTLDKENTSATKFIDNSKDAKVSEESKYGKSTESDIVGDKYKAVYVQGLENKKLATGESAYIYLTFQVNKDSSGRVILDDDSSPKENLAEINGYKTYYKDGTQLPNGVSKGSNDIAGLLDRDSNPGNLEEKDLEGEKYEKNFEDDTDRAPSLRVIIDEEAIRKANGTVWEDERNQEVDGALIGDGVRDDEIGIAGVTVQLIEKCVDGKTEYVWAETKTDSNGKYNFESFIPGDYIIRFQYGDTKETAISKEKGGSNVTAYNGQDFKSTLYQAGIDQEGLEATDLDDRYEGYTDTEKQNETGKYNPEKGNPQDDTFGYDIYELDADDTNYSDAKDIWSRRDAVINYSDENVTNHKAEVLASPYSGDESLYKELIDNTKMVAETGIIVAEFEYDRQQSDGLKDTENNKDNSSKDYIDEANRKNGGYTLNDIDFGLVERPKAQLEIDKSVANVKVTLANGSILFDINKAANNAIWKDHEEYNIDEKKKDGKYEEYYGSDNKHRYSYRIEIDKIVKNTDRGLIQLTMDEELMHGATIQITYTLKVTNVGEIDYVDTDSTKDFYYNGDNSGTNVVTTTANQVVDYVQNNLQFDSNNKVNSQDKWSVITAQDILSGDLVNDRFSEQLTKFNTIIQTDSLSENLVPGQEISKTLILSQLITPENEEDDLTYGNMVEIVKTSNTVGRRMAYSVVGNQNPMEEEPSEVDTSVAEKIVILPPFGEVRIYYILGAVVAIMLIGGIILIRKKVLKGKDE